MTLHRLETDEFYLHTFRTWHLCYYMRDHNDETDLTDHVLSFKANDKDIVAKWCKWAAAELTEEGIKFDLIVRALGSAETAPSGDKALDELGRCLAVELETIYRPEVLKKKRATKPLHKLYNVPDRKKEIADVYFVDDNVNDYNKKKVLIIDDITTSNVTMAEILRALKAKWPKGQYYVFCLAKTCYEGDKNANIVQKYL